MTNITKVDGRKNNGKNLKGRPKGVKNKTTLFKEAMRNGFENLLMEKGQKIFEVVADKAIEGDMQAAKMILDRVLPATKAIDLEQLEKSKGLTIDINIGGMPARETLDVEIVEGEILDE